MSKILLFIPCYNCEKQIIRVLNQLNDEILSYVAEIIVINNQSTDHTEAVVIDFINSHQAFPIKLLRNRKNYNLGGSHKVAFHYAIDHDFSHVIVFHGDDQGSIRDLLPILKKRIYRKYDCCLGARFQKGSRLYGYSLFRTFGNRVYNWMFSIALCRRIYDLGSGLNIYAAEMLRDLFFEKFPDQLTFNYCMILAARYYRHRCYFFPISWREEDQVSNVKIAGQAFHVLGMLVKYFFLRGSFIKSELRELPVDRYEADVIASFKER